MESVPPIGTTAVVVIGAVACLGLIILGGVLWVVVRSGIFGDVLGGLGVALGRSDKDLGDAGLFGEDTPDYRPRPRRSGGRRNAADIRARYDQQFDARLGGGEQGAVRPPPAPPSRLDEPSDRPDEASKRRYKRRFYEEDADRDDEIDSFIDDLEL